MNAVVTFHKPEVATPHGLDGVAIWFPFERINIAETPYPDERSTHGITVTISGTLLSEWGFDRVPNGDISMDLCKTMFEFAKQEVARKIQNSTLQRREKLELHGGNAPNRNPYDPRKIEEPNGFVMEIVPADVSVPKGAPEFKTPFVFISYSWDDPTHKSWVQKFAARLKNDGVNVVIDQQLPYGVRIPHFMEQAVSGATQVLVVLTPEYKRKSDGRIRGVGYEGHIMTAELLAERNEREIITILRGSMESVVPIWAKGKLHVNLAGDPYNEDEYKNLLQQLLTACSLTSAAASKVEPQLRPRNSADRQDQGKRI